MEATCIVGIRSGLLDKHENVLPLPCIELLEKQIIDELELL